MAENRATVEFENDDVDLKEEAKRRGEIYKYLWINS